MPDLKSESNTRTVARRVLVFSQPRCLRSAPPKHAKPFCLRSAAPTLARAFTGESVSLSLRSRSSVSSGSAAPAFRCNARSSSLFCLQAASRVLACQGRASSKDTVPPNPSIERTSQGLRPRAASHVKR